MGLALSVVSKRLATLEGRAEVRLIARSTRSLALTEEGQHVFERAQRILAEVDEAEAALTRGRAEPEGVLRVSAPHALGRAHVSPVCRDLVRAYPKISAELILRSKAALQGGCKKHSKPVFGGAGVSDCAVGGTAMHISGSNPSLYPGQRRRFPCLENLSL